MHSRMRHAAALAVALALVWACASSAQSPLKNHATGNPAVKSMEAISFGPEGTLLIGDGKGKQIVAIETGDTKPQMWTKTEVPNIKDQLGGRLGTTGKGIDIIKMAVNPASHTAYFAVRSSGNDLVLTMDGAGKVNEFRLENVKHVRVPVPADGKVTKITDITWAGDRVLVCAQANETFGSKVLSIKAPLASDGSCGCFSTDTYHVGHGKWETKAPIRTIMSYEEAGKKYAVGSFTCTPIVKYPIDDLTPDAKVKGV